MEKTGEGGGENWAVALSGHFRSNNTRNGAIFTPCVRTRLGLGMHYRLSKRLLPLENENRQTIRCFGGSILAPNPQK